MHIAAAAAKCHLPFDLEAAERNASARAPCLLTNSVSSLMLQATLRLERNVRRFPSHSTAPPVAIACSHASNVSVSGSFMRCVTMRSRLVAMVCILVGHAPGVEALEEEAGTRSGACRRRFHWPSGGFADSGLCFLHGPGVEAQGCLRSLPFNQSPARTACVAALRVAASMAAAPPPVSAWAPGWTNRSMCQLLSSH